MKKLFTAALVSLACAGTASADQIYIDTGFDYNGGTGTADTAAGDTTTGWKDSLKLVFDSNSTVYDLDASGTISAGDTITSKGGLEVGAINSNKVTDLVAAEVFGSGPSDNAYGGSNWVLSFRFDDLMGTYDGTSFNYTSGTIDWVLFDGQSGGLANEIHLFTTDISSHSYEIGNQVFNGVVNNFGTDTVNGVDAGDVFNIAHGLGAMSFEDYAAQGNDVRFRIDQNTDQPNVIGADFTGPVGEIYISGAHDGSLEFAVPEPASVAILGLGLLGFAASRRKA